MEKLLTVKEAAELLGLTENIVRDYLAEGKIQGAKFGRVWRIHPEDLKAFYESQKPKPLKADG